MLIKHWDCTIDEYVHAHYRILELDGHFKRLQIKAIFSAIPAFIIMYAISYTFSPVEPVDGLVFSAILALAVGIGYPQTIKPTARNNIRKSVIKTLKSNQPFPCIYTLSDEGIAFNWNDTEIKFSWSRVTEVNDLEDAIEVVMQDSGITIFPKRIFDSTEEIQQWLDYIEQHRAQ